MINKLKPCPFCGCDYEKDDEDFIFSGDHEPWCPLRGIAYGGYGLTVSDYDDEKRAWNTRHERTCHVESNTYDDERDCFTTKLSCGCLITSGLSFRCKYCPNCGAKVVEDE